MANEAAEFVRNYEYCFFRIQLKSSKQFRAFMLTHMDTIGDSKSFFGKTVTRTLQNKSMHFPVAEFMARPEPIIACNGFLNCLLTRPTALLMQVSPDRQYRKGLCMDGSNSVAYLSTGSREIIELCGEKNKALNTGDYIPVEDWLTRAVALQLSLDGYPIYKGIRAALGLVEDGTAHSVAISKFFAVSLRRGYRVPVLWHKTQMVGVIFNGVAYVTEPTFPFAEFFYKRFEFPMKSLKEAPKLEETIR